MLKTSELYIRFNRFDQSICKRNKKTIRLSTIKIFNFKFYKFIKRVILKILQVFKVNIFVFYENILFGFKLLQKISSSYGLNK